MWRKVVHSDEVLLEYGRRELVKQVSVGMWVCARGGRGRIVSQVA